MKESLKRAVKIAVYYSPHSLKDFLKKKIEEKRLKEGVERYKQHKVSKEDVENILNQIDFSRDILLHTSTLNIGNISGGVKYLTTALLNHIDLDRRTLLVSALPYFGSFADYLEKIDYFDVRTAPIAMGEINSRLAKHPLAVRSVHPTHSVVAIGKNAEYYTESHHLDSTPFSSNSPYYKLIKNRGKVLLFGATMNNMTLVHAIEDAVGINHPVKDIYSKKSYRINCINSKGEPIVVETKVHNPKRAIFRRDIMLEEGLKRGFIRRWELGAGAVFEVDAYQYALCYIEKMKQGQNLYGKCQKLPQEFNLTFD